VDEDWDRGAIHTFLITYSMARPDAAGDRAAAAREHFERAVRLSAGKAAAPHVSWAEAVCLPREDRACFDSAIAAALEVDPDSQRATRLANTVMRERAAWLAKNVDHWILPPLDESATEPGASS
jgi:predicted anti-sigma-YlaC factor YlaD